MKAIITIGILVVVFLIARRLITEYQTIEKSGPDNAAQTAAKSVLPGLPPDLEASLQAAKKQGLDGIEEWLTTYRPYVEDPRLAAIQLDYVVLLNRRDPARAKQVFEAVKKRVPPSSPVYPRIKELEKTYE